MKRNFRISENPRLPDATRESMKLTDSTNLEDTSLCRRILEAQEALVGWLGSRSCWSNRCYRSAIGSTVRSAIVRRTVAVRTIVVRMVGVITTTPAIAAATGAHVEAHVAPAVAQPVVVVAPTARTAPTRTPPSVGRSGSSQKSSNGSGFDQIFHLGISKR